MPKEIRLRYYDLVNAAQEFEAGKDPQGFKLFKTLETIADTPQLGSTTLGPEHIVAKARAIIGDPHLYGLKSNSRMFTRYALIFLEDLYRRRHYKEFLEFIVELEGHSNENVREEAKSMLDKMLLKGIITRNELKALEEEVFDY